MESSLKKRIPTKPISQREKNRKRKRKTNNQLAKHSTAIAATITMAGSPLSAKNAKVSNNGDSGAGTFRAAVAKANADDSIKKNSVLTKDRNRGASEFRDLPWRLKTRN
jgi:hypothetical protein